MTIYEGLALKEYSWAEGEYQQVSNYSTFNFLLYWSVVLLSGHIEKQEMEVE